MSVDGDPPKRRRLFAQLPVHVAQDHHDVMWPVYRAMGSRHLPTSGLAWVHFDSHPDMVLPENLTPAEARDLAALRARLSIASFLLPAVFAGHIDTLVWLCVCGSGPLDLGPQGLTQPGLGFFASRPPWAQQMPEGRHVLRIGVHAGVVKVDSQLSYFTDELLTAPPGVQVCTFVGFMDSLVLTGWSLSSLTSAGLSPWRSSQSSLR